MRHSVMEDSSSLNASDQPLLKEAEHPEDGENDADQGRDAGDASTESVGKEVKRVLALAGPISASELLAFVSYAITTAQVGRLGADALSTYTLACTVFHITGLSLVVGIASGQSTFSGQAFGAKQYKLVGVLLQRSAAISVLVAAAAIGLWGAAGGQLMVALHQDEALVPGALHMLYLMSPSLVLYALLTCAQTYFTSQGVVAPLAIVSGMGVLVTPLVNHLFITTLGGGLIGAAVASNIMAAVELLAMAAVAVWLHVSQEPTEQTWGGVDIQGALSGWGEYLKIAAPSCAMICLEWWGFEVVVLIAGLQENAAMQVGAMAVLFETHALAFMVAAGFGGAACMRVSNTLGAGHHRAALRASVTSAVLSLLCELGVAAALVAAARPWAHLYASDPQQAEVIIACMPLVAVGVISDSLNASLAGVLEGSGHQTLGLLVNLATFWAVGIPAAAYLDLHQGWGARGVWIALAGASLLQATVLVVSVSCFDWPAMARRAQRLVQAAGGDAGDEPDGEITRQEALGPTNHGAYEPLIGTPAV